MKKRILEEIDFILKRKFEVYKKKYNKEKIGVLVSGGIDSSIIGWWVKKFFPNCIFLSVANEKTKDWFYLGILEEFLKIKIIKIDYDLINLKKSILNVERVYKKYNFSFDLTQISLGAAFWLVLKEAKKRKIKILFSGQGPDVLLAGYYRYQNVNINKLNRLIKNDLFWLKKDKKREKILADEFGISMVYPYLEEDFISLCLKIPAGLKIKEKKEKFILREYGKVLGLPEEIVNRPKKAFQYSTGVFKEIKKLVELKG